MLAKAFRHFSILETKMTNVSHKQPTVRVARAQALVIMQPRTLELLKDLKLSKGNALVIAEVAGIQAAKNTF